MTDAPACRRLPGRVALVTGATGGIGRALTCRLAAEGATVVATDLDGGACAALAAELPAGSAEGHGEVTGTALDVTDEAAWRRVVADIVAAHGGLHVLVNNAGIGNPATVEDETLEGWERVTAVSQRGVWLGMKHAGPAIEAAGGGSVVNICSIFGATGGFGTTFSYHAAKGAVRLMTKNAALHWAARGVRVNSVHPGFVATPVSTALYPPGTPRHDAMLGATPMGRLADPEEMCGAVAFLASDDSSYVTGSELYVDGGYTAR